MCAWPHTIFHTQIIWKYYFSSRSATDIGSLYNVRNRLNRTNVPTDVKKDFNACEDFIETVTQSQIVAAALPTFDMKSVSDTPSERVIQDAENLWMKPRHERKACLHDLCLKVYKKYISLSHNSSSENYVQNDSDCISSYSIQLLRIGVLYMEFADAIREGDGERVFWCWRYFLPIFRAAHSTNYSCEALHFLHQHLYALSPRLSNQLIWGRFVNVRGIPGRNIPLDLHMEHLNRIAKGAIHNLKSNKTMRSISRVGRAIGTLAPLMEMFDEENSVPSTSSKYRKPSAEKDVYTIVEQLMKHEVFSIEPGRKLKHFKNPKDLFSTASNKDLLDWMVSRLTLL